MRTQFATIIIAMATTSAFAEVHEILQQGFGFVPDTVTANPGDTIRWIHGSGSHTVNHGDCVLEDVPHFSGPLNVSSPVLEWVIPDAVNGTIPFFCDVLTHCVSFQMSGEINVAPPSGSTVHDVAQQGFTFVPEQITVSPGDTVRWTWSSGFHTVTSGDNNTCIADNGYFNVPLDETHNVVLWVVPNDMPESADYFCDLHCGIGHIGTIERAVLGDLTGDGCVNGADLSILLGSWSNLGGPADFNNDNIVDGADLSTLLGAWSSSCA